jgi:outer membrane protein insertion porin family
MLHRSVLSAAAWGLLLGSLATFPAHAQPTTDATSEAQAVSAGSGTIRDIRVEGNQRIETRTIITYLAITPGQSFSQTEINEGLKNLYSTGFFADIKLLRQGNTLIVQVLENPVISRVAFEGNSSVDTADLEKEIELQARAIYSRDKVQSDVQRMLNIYRRGGRYNAVIEPKLIQQDQNRVDLVYEINEGPVARVEKITFIGNENFDNDTLRKAIRTEETGWYKFLSDNDKYDPDRLQFDQELLRRFYLSEGFADFQVKSANAELSPDKTSFYVTFVVDEGPQYTFGDIKVVNQLQSKEPPDFGSAIITEAGDTYNATEVEDSIEAMTNLLGDQGYAFVDIQPKLDRDKEKKIVNLSYVVKPGPRVYVERINITGNVRTLDEVIRREFRLNEGDPYNTSKLQRSEQRINNLGFFEKVEVKNEEGSAPDKTVVNVDVKEKSTGEINLGAGYSTTDGVLGQVGIAERNLLGRGQELKSNFTLASRRRQAQLGFTEPYFMDYELAAGFDVYRTYKDYESESSFISDSKGVTLHGKYALLEKLSHTVFYQLRQTDIKDVKVGASTFILEQQGTNVTSSIGHSLSYDERDNKFSPTKGYYVSLTQEFAGLGGDSRFFRHELKASYYYPIYPKWVIGLLGSGGNITGIGDNVRINDRFFIGGDSFRGFKNAGIGPRDITTNDALGGNNYYVGTAELRFPLGLPDELGLSGAVFSDVGSLWDVDSVGANIFDDSALRASGGAGLLWTSPFGPIRIDFAHAFLKEPVDRTENIRFSFGTRF